MSRWVSSKVSANVEDLTTDLADGLVLVELINNLMEESLAAPYVLLPVYKLPNFSLQKIENVADLLKFCRLVLKINTCNISAEDIVGGNLKLILGLIWTLFVFLFSHRGSSVSNDSRSIVDIKMILLKWVNSVGRGRALPEVNNFNKDWSLQQDKRPDLIFACILKFYSPDAIVYNDFVSGKKYANLEKLMHLAQSGFDIPILAEALDFNVLVPDEKCVILYLLQWYLYFEGEHAQREAPDPKYHLQSNQEQSSSFISHVVSAVRYRNKYETKALRLLNQLSSNISKMTLLILDIVEFQAENALVSTLNEHCTLLLATKNLELALTKREDCAHILSLFSRFFSVCDEYKRFKTEVKPVLCTQDIPELRNLMNSVNYELKKCGLAGYEPFKTLSLPILVARLESLELLEKELASHLETQMAAISASNLKHVDANIGYLLDILRARGRQVCDETTKYAESLEQIRQCKIRMSQEREVLAEKHSVAEVRALIVSIDSLEIPETPETPQVSEYVVFKDGVESLKNKKNLTFYDLKLFFKNCLSLHDCNNSLVKEFVKFIPTRKLLTLSDSDDLSGHLTLDDSDHSLNIFDRVLQTLEVKLSGAHNRLYDLTLFVNQLEDGFCIHC